MKVQNKGGKGNPNHDDNTGEFTEENGSSQKQSEEESSLSFELQFNIDSIDDFINSIDFLTNKEKDEQADLFMSNLGNLEYINHDLDIPEEDKKSLLFNSSFEYDKNKLASLTSKQINALLSAESVCFAKNKFDQELILSEKQKNDLKQQQEEEIKQESAKEFGSELGPYIGGVWYDGIYGEDFDSKNIPDENGKTAIDRKREYFQDIINKAKEIIEDPLAFADDIETQQYLLQGSQQKLDNLNKWVEDCQKYKELKFQIQNKYIDAILQAEEKYQETQKQKYYFNSEDFLNNIELANKYIENFQDLNAPYSQARKNNAKWFKNADAATKYFGPIFDKKLWVKLTTAEQKQLIDYTGGGYSKYNRPLRGLKHAGWSGFGFAQAVTNLTNAIEKCTWDDDIWVQRGIGDTAMFKLPGSDKLTKLGNLSEKELQSLVGMSFTDKGFYSSGAGKGTGFSGEIILNTYCPKGTKMAYMNTKGHYAYGSENEMILQRGYSYKIVKVEKSDFRIYIDCEVILGSDKNNITDMSELTAIGEKYL